MDVNEISSEDREFLLHFLENREKIAFNGLNRNFKVRLPEIAGEIRRLVNFINQWGGDDETVYWTSQSVRKRLIYRLGRYIYKKELEQKLRSFVEEELSELGLRLRKSENSTYAKSPFYLCLRAVYPDDGFLKSGQKSQIAAELERAFKENVKPKRLIGYIHQTNKSAVAAAAQARQREAMTHERKRKADQ